MTLYSNTILLELLWEAQRIKAIGTFRKCMKAGKNKWAMKIASKYSLQLPQHDDTVMAFAFALQTLKTKQ